LKESEGVATANEREKFVGKLEGSTWKWNTKKRKLDL